MKAVVQAISRHQLGRRPAKHTTKLMGRAACGHDDGRRRKQIVRRVIRKNRDGPTKCVEARDAHQPRPAWIDH
jgi:hypothetical protein